VRSTSRAAGGERPVTLAATRPEWDSNLTMSPSLSGPSGAARRFRIAVRPTGCARADTGATRVGESAAASTDRVRRRADLRTHPTWLAHPSDTGPADCRSTDLGPHR